MTDILANWDQLDVQIGETDGYVRLRISAIRACAAYAARRLGTGFEALILEIGTASLPPVSEYPRSAGFEVISEVLEPGRSGRTRLVLSLTDQRFRDVFRALCEDTVRALSASSIESDAARRFIARLVRWQAFLRKFDPAGLSLECRRGLFGELYFLEHVLLKRINAKQAIKGWTGSRGAVFDYQFLHGCIEVKTTSAITPHAIRVNNAGQLDNTGVEALYLLIIVVTESESGTISLPEIIEALRSELKEPERGEFDELLLEAGYLDIHRELYLRPRYTVRSTTYMRVEQDFPRLIAAMLPFGVENVTYSVAIAAGKPFEQDEEQVLRQVLAGIALSHE